MSGIDDLIRRHCPDGAEFKTVESVCVVFSGFAFKSECFNTSGLGTPLVRIRDVNTGLSGTYYSGEYDDRFVVNNGDILIGMDGDFRAIRWRHGFALLNQRVCRLERFESTVLPDFIYYVIQDVLNRIQSGTQGSTVKHLSSRALGLARIPVPPIEVQREIVRVLDLFRSLEAELEAELEARRGQYAHYRDSLMNFGESVPRIPIGELGEIYRGRRFTKEDYVSDGLPAIHYGELYTEYGPSANVAVTHVRPDLEPILRFAQPGDVVIAEVGETVEDVGKATAWLGDAKVAIHDGCYGFRHSMNPKFVAYYLQTATYHAEKSRHVARAKVKRLSMTGIKQVRLPVPSVAEQERIVRFLDGFDALINDLSVGLPAELLARRRQYEYYRDRLLTFEEAA